MALALLDAVALWLLSWNRMRGTDPVSGLLGDSLWAAGLHALVLMSLPLSGAYGLCRSELGQKTVVGGAGLGFALTTACVVVSIFWCALDLGDISNVGFADLEVYAAVIFGGIALLALPFQVALVGRLPRPLGAVRQPRIRATGLLIVIGLLATLHMTVGLGEAGKAFALAAIVLLGFLAWTTVFVLRCSAVEPPRGALFGWGLMAAGAAAVVAISP